MGLRRTMNRKIRQKEKEKTQIEQWEYLDKYLKELIPQLNLRLLLDMELGFVQRDGTEMDTIVFSSPKTLWVDSISVIEYKTACAKKGFARRISNCLIRWWGKRPHF